MPINYSKLLRQTSDQTHRHSERDKQRGSETFKQRNIEKETRKPPHTNRQNTHKYTDLQTDKDRNGDKQTPTWTDRHRERKRERERDKQTATKGQWYRDRERKRETEREKERQRERGGGENNYKHVEERCTIHNMQTHRTHKYTKTNPGTSKHTVSNTVTVREARKQKIRPTGTYRDTKIFTNTKSKISKTDAGTNIRPFKHKGTERDGETKINTNIQSL